MKATIFGVVFSSTLIVAILLGLGAGALGAYVRDPGLSFIGGCLFIMPFAFLLGSANGREDERRKLGKSTLPIN